MFVAALLALVLGALLVVVAVMGGGADARLDLGAYTLQTSASAVFFLGMASLALIVLALVMFRSAARTAAARRRDRKKVSQLSSRLDEYQRDEQAPGQDPAGR